MPTTTRTRKNHRSTRARDNDSPASADPLTEGLPANVNAERMVLGSIVADAAQLVNVRAFLNATDFILEKHRVLYSAMCDLADRGESIDRVTLAEELTRTKKLAAVDGFSYVARLDEGLPKIPNIDAYCRIVREKSTLRRIVYASQTLQTRALLQEDPSDVLLAEASANFLELSTTSGEATMQTPASIIDAVGIDGLCERGTAANGAGTGFIGYDRLTGGIHEGELVILAARPSMGKTAYALNIADHLTTRYQYSAAYGKKSAAIWSLEMSAESLLIRMICARARVDSWAFRAGLLKPDERQRVQQAAAALYDANLYIDDSATITVPDIHTRVRRLKRADPNLSLVIVDYLQLVQSHREVDNRNLEIGIMSRGLKQLARDEGVGVLALSQLSRACDTRSDHRPMLSDLRESGNVEQDADTVAFIYREFVYKPDREDLRHSAELLLRKQRNGPTGNVELVYSAYCTRFDNMAKDLDDDGQ